MRDRSSTALPVSGVAYVGEHRAGGVEIVRDGDAVQIIRRSQVVDDGARLRVKQHRNCELIGEGDADVGRGLSRRILLIDFLDWDKEILTVGSDRRGGAVDEPDRIPLRLV